MTYRSKSARRTRRCGVGIAAPWLAVLFIALAAHGTARAQGDVKEPAAEQPAVKLNLDVLEKLRAKKDAAADQGEYRPAEAKNQRTVTLAKPATPVSPAAPKKPELTVAPPLPRSDQSRSVTPPPIIPIPTVSEPTAATAEAPEKNQELARHATPQEFEGRERILIFPTLSPALTLEAAEQLNAMIPELAGNDVRVELHAFAGGPDDSTSDTRRLSLKRALAVRGYLVEKGLDPLRIDLHAVGPAPDDGPADRVDIRFLVP